MTDLKERAQREMSWEELIKEEVDYIISRVKREMHFTNFGEGEEVLRLIPDRRFFRKDIIRKLSADEYLKSIGCYAEELFEFEIAIYKK